MKLPTKAERIASEAVSWLGTPFYPHIATKGVGTDCVQLVLAVFKAADAAPADMVLPEYKLSTGEHASSSIVDSWLDQCPAVAPAEGPPIMGDVVTFNMGRVSHHVGVMIGDQTFVHCIRGYGTITGDMRDSTWSSRLLRIWRPIP